MNRDQKAQIIERLRSELNENNIIYLTDLTGLNAEATARLRSACFKANVKLSVVKNTLLAKAMEESEKDFGELKSVLKGNTSLMYAHKGNVPAKVIQEFAKKSDKLKLKGAYVEEAIFVGEQHLSALSQLKSKDELLADIVALLQSPAKNVISALKSGGGKIAGIVKTLSERPE